MNLEDEDFDLDVPRIRPKQCIRLEIVTGVEKVVLSWEPRTGVLKIGRINLESHSGGLFGKQVEKLKADSVADVLTKAGELLSTVFDQDAMSAFKTLVRKMSALIPKGSEEDKGQIG